MNNTSHSIKDIIKNTQNLIWDEMHAQFLIKLFFFNWFIF